MSYSLLLDSSDKNLSVGLSKDGVFFDSISYEAWQRQSEYMITEIDAMLEKHSITKDDISAVAVGKGPGSYTGIRIAMSIAKTISYALSCPLYLISSLQLLEDASDKPSICLMNARSKRSYIGVYKGKEVIMEDKIMDNPKVLEYVNEHPDYLVCGDVSYLGLEAKEPEILANLSRMQDKEHLSEEPLGATPVYLKDNYLDSQLKVTIRKMNSADLKSVIEIENESFKHPYTEKEMLYELNENPVASLYVAMVGPDVVGFIDFMITFDSSTISQIGVKEAYRSKGIGNLLLGQMLKDCRAQEEPVEFITLEVRESNLRAQKFYKKHAFEAVTTKKSYYADGENAIYMVRSLING